MEDSSDVRSPFINTRCRLQRLKDAKFFAGWVKDFSPQELLVLLSTKTALAYGDMFSVELHGTDRSAMFNAELKSQNSDDISLKIQEQVRYMPSRERARLRIEGLGGAFNYNGVDTPFSLNDVSLAGCGIVTPYSIPRGAKLNLHIDTDQGVVKCVGEVRYCKPDGNIEGAFRLGILLEPMGRLETARWNNLFEFYSAA